MQGVLSPVTRDARVVSGLGLGTSAVESEADIANSHRVQCDLIGDDPWALHPIVGYPRRFQPIAATHSANISAGV